MDLHHQPSDSESDVPLIELWDRGNGVGCRICPDVSSFTRRVHDLLRQADLGGNWRTLRGLAPHAIPIARSVFETVPARWSGLGSLELMI